MGVRTRAALTVFVRSRQGPWLAADRAARYFCLGLPVEPRAGQRSRESRQAARTARAQGLHHRQRRVRARRDRTFLNVVNTGFGDYDDIDWSRTEPHIRSAYDQAKQIDSLTLVRSLAELQRHSRKIVARWGDEFDVLVTPTMTIEPPVAGACSRRCMPTPTHLR